MQPGIPAELFAEGYMAVRSPNFLRRPGLIILALQLCSALLCGSANAASRIEIWHSLRGASADTFTELIQRFNQSQNDIVVDAEYKGNAASTVMQAIGATRDKKSSPHLLQVADDLGGAVLDSKGLARPLSEVLALAPSPDFQFFKASLAGFTRDARGQQYGFPLEVSVPLFFYNKDAYRSAGLDPDAPPKTWRELQAHRLALTNTATGVRCGYTTSDQAWIHVENLGAAHGEAIANKNNGNDSGGASLTFNGLLHVRHTALMMAWVKSQLFTYTGHEKEGDARFLSGECATLSSASSALAGLIAGAKFSYGVAPMPYYEEGAARPMGSLAGGSALWVMAGKKPAEYLAVARFLGWFATPANAIEWHQRSGNLPLTDAVWRASDKAGFYERISGLGPIMKTLATSNGMAAGGVRDVRLAHHERVREIINAQLEAVWDGSKAAKQGLDDAVRLGNSVLRDGGKVLAAGSPAPARARSGPLAPRL